MMAVPSNSSFFYLELYPIKCLTSTHDYNFGKSYDWIRGFVAKGRYQQEQFVRITIRTCMHTFRQETRRGAVATIPHRVPSGINHQNRQIYVHTQPQTSPYENPTNLTTPARNSSLTMSSPLPHASDYLPSISPGVVYSTAHATWTDQELRFLHDGLQNYPADKYDNVTRYIKIAATIPGKCVRDVAYQVKSMHLFDQNQVSPPPQDRELPIKRMRLEEPEVRYWWLNHV